MKSQGFQFYLADHPEDKQLYDTGQQDVAYRHFLGWLGGLLSEEIGVLFSPTDPANRLYPPQRVLDDVLDLINSNDLTGIWTEDETIGWVYQYFTPKELRDQARKESAAPRNSYELAFRNQFFTPRYVVEFLTDNTLGRIWYEMRKGDTKLKDQCRYMVRRPSEIFLADGQLWPDPTQVEEGLSQEELLKLPVHIPHRPKKDPREHRILDPACGSGHFLLYCFALLLMIYEEAYADPDLGPKLREDYPTLEALRKDVPRLILAHNLHGIDIDLRATQIAALALWLRCQRAYQDMGLKQDRPKITRSNLVCAEPMPGEVELLEEFIERCLSADAEQRLMADIVRKVFDAMKLASEAGSLLRIEEELSGTLAAAKKLWVERPPSIQLPLFTIDPIDQGRERPLVVAGITDESFWEEAEERIYAALKDYAEAAQNGHKLQRRLFAEDSVRGLAFMDLCQRRYDVVLMNPPFGDGIASVAQYISSSFPLSKNDLYATFVERGLHVLTPHGLLGAITSRMGFFAANLEKWRNSNFLGPSGYVSVVADLGHGVLDSALVEAAAYVLSRNASTERTQYAFFASVLNAADKGNRLRAIITGDSPAIGTRFVQSLNSIRQLPGKPLAYWLPTALEHAIAQMPALRTLGGKAAVGVQTDDDFRFLRLLSEVPTANVGRDKKWVALSKGGEYSPYYDDIYLVVNWENDGEEIKAFVELHYGQWSKNVRNVNLYFQLGLTYPERTTSDFSPRPLPRDSIFSIKGPGIFFDSIDLRYAFLGFAYSRVCKMLLEVFIGLGDAVESGSAARDYRAGIFNSLPFPQALANREFTNVVKTCIDSLQSLYRYREDSTHFYAPALVFAEGNSLRSRYLTHRSLCEDVWLRVLEASWICDEACSACCGLNREGRQLLRESVTSHPCEYPKGNIDEHVFQPAFQQGIDCLVDEVSAAGTSRHLTKKTFWANRHLELLCHRFQAHPLAVISTRRKHELIDRGEFCTLVKDVISYCCGAAFGRWDVRKAVARESVDIRDAFEPIPSQPDGMLRCQHSNEQPGGYPLDIHNDGVIPDDPDHFQDIVRRVWEAVELVWEDRAEAIEQEACEILGVNELRDYFRKPGKGGFWDDHVSRYSKSRRKAPIYWLLQSSKKSYGLWLYYHRLDKDILFKARQNYVDPKIRLEQSRLDALRSQKATLGADAKGIKKIDKDIDRQDTLLGELKDFADKLERAAKLNFGKEESLNSDVTYDPDLNDGVVLNIAPLWELVPWKEAKKYWEELLEGKYEWSSMGKLLRKKGLVTE